MRYSGLDIANITLGSSCDARLVNNYSYDALHRITAMHNSLQRPGLPAEDAYSTSYSYDRAGNIQRLSRRGFVGMSGNTPVYDLIDDLHYSYAGANPAANAFSSKLQGVDDMVTNTAAQPRGVFLPSSGYGYDDNGNMISAGSVSAEYNILNLPTVLSTSSGDRKLEYVFGGGKYSAELITGNQAIDEMRHYVGGMEFKNGVLEAYNFGDGRVVWENGVPKFQYRLADHLGNTVVFFEDKNNNGCITTEEEATSEADLEIVQRLLYYPFGMALEGLGAWNAQPWQQYRYNGKERDTLTGWYDYGARWGLLDIGRWNGVDPLAGHYLGISPYAYVLNNPIQFTDPDGRAPQSPIFGQDGKFLETDSEGFKGDIVIMRERTYNALTNNGKNTLDHSITKKIIGTDNSFFAQTLDDFVANDFDIANSRHTELLSNVFTNLLSAAKAEGLISYDISNLAFGKIGIDNDTDRPNGHAATMYDAGGGKDAISILIKPGNNGGNFSMMYVGDAANAIHILGVHEPLHRKYPHRGMAGHHPMYKEIYSNPEYRKSLKNVTPAVKELAEKWRKNIK